MCVCVCVCVCVSVCIPSYIPSYQIFTPSSSFLQLFNSSVLLIFYFLLLEELKEKHPNWPWALLLPHTALSNTDYAFIAIESGRSVWLRDRILSISYFILSFFLLTYLLTYLLNYFFSSSPHSYHITLAPVTLNRSHNVLYTSSSLCPHYQLALYIVSNCSLFVFLFNSLDVCSVPRQLIVPLRILATWR